MLWTDSKREMLWIVDCFVSRWQVAVSFEEARRHLGVDSQCQRSDKVIERTTSILFGLFSWVILLTHYWYDSGHLIVALQIAWYTKRRSTL